MSISQSIGRIMHAHIEKCRFEECIWHPYFWPRNGNKNGWFKARYLASIFLALRKQWKRPIRGKIFCVSISGLFMAMKKANSRQDILRPYLWPCDGNEKGQFEERYLASVFLPLDGNEKGQFKERYLVSIIFLASRRQWKRPNQVKISRVNISGLFEARYLTSIFFDWCQDISRPYFWPCDSNEKGPFEEIFWVSISGLSMAMKKANSRQDILRPYFWPCDGNEKDPFQERYLTSVFLASWRQWKWPIRGQISGVHISGLLAAMKKAESSNENGWFKARYLASMIWGRPHSGLKTAMKMADSRTSTSTSTSTAIKKAILIPKV